MLNNCQKHLLETILSFSIENITELEAPYAIEALNAIFATSIPDFTASSLKSSDTYDDVIFLRKIINHPCPQNRSTGSPYIHIPGYVSWFDDKGEIRSEPSGLLSLTSKNNEIDPHVSKDDVVEYIRNAVEQLLLKKRRELIIDSLDKESSSPDSLCLTHRSAFDYSLNNDNIDLVITFIKSNIQLKEIYFGRLSKFSQDNLTKLAESIPISLDLLNMDGPISEDVVEYFITRVIHRCKNIKKLFISSMRISTHTPNISNILQRHENIEKVNFRNCRLSILDLDVVLSLVSHHQSLKRIEFQGEDFNESSNGLTDFFSSNLCSKELVLASNMSDKFLEGLLLAIQSNKRVTSLSIMFSKKNNSINLIQRILQAISNNNIIKSLEIQYNPNTLCGNPTPLDGFITAISEFIKTNSSLESLVLGFRVDSRGINTITDAILENNYLIHLELCKLLCFQISFEHRDKVRLKIQKNIQDKEERASLIQGRNYLY